MPCHSAEEMYSVRNHSGSAKKAMPVSRIPSLISAWLTMPVLESRLFIMPTTMTVERKYGM